LGEQSGTKRKYPCTKRKKVWFRLKKKDRNLKKNKKSKFCGKVGRWFRGTYGEKKNGAPKTKKERANKGQQFLLRGRRWPKKEENGGGKKQKSNGNQLKGKKRGF